MLKLSDDYQKLGPEFYQETLPSIDPELGVDLRLFNERLAKDLGFDDNLLASKEKLAKFFSGQELLPGSKPKALVYAGHQFGHFVPQLGDGRAHILGQANGFDIQLKGSGQTAFSRQGDGKSALGPVIREYILSEAMHALGVPTTRALAAVEIDTNVFRQDGPENSGVFTRVADSHIRVGSFQYHAGQESKSNLEKLLLFSIDKHYPEIQGTNIKQKTKSFLLAFAQKQIDLVLQWSRIGFIHGVMNTDNCSIAGITIDFGPCAFMDEYERQKVFSSIDRRGRYSFYNQLGIIQWNILRLADCLLDFIADDTNQAVKEVEELLSPLFQKTEQAWLEIFCEKLGLNKSEKDRDLAFSFLDLLEKNKQDFTNSFTELTYNKNLTDTSLSKIEGFEKWFSEWNSLSPDLEKMKKLNPVYIPRNHLVEKAITEAYDGNWDFCHSLIEVCTSPYDSPNKWPDFQIPPTEEQKVEATFCGT